MTQDERTVVNALYDLGAKIDSLIDEIRGLSEVVDKAAGFADEFLEMAGKPQDDTE